MRDIERQMRALLDRQQIYEVLTRYCRGVDRGDVELIRSVYHADATDDHGMFKGLGVDFASWIVEFLKDWKQCQHFIGNFNCNLQGDVAHTETYCLSISDDGQGHNSAVYNRYIDRFERRKGEWKIADRLIVRDGTSHGVRGTRTTLPTSLPQRALARLLPTVHVIRHLLNRRTHVRE
jgi:hypothetical protein